MECPGCLRRRESVGGEKSGVDFFQGGGATGHSLYLAVWVSLATFRQSTFRDGWGMAVHHRGQSRGWEAWMQSCRKTGCRGGGGKQRCICPGGSEARAPHLHGPSAPCTKLCSSHLLCSLKLVIFLKVAAPPPRRRCELQVLPNPNPPLGDGGWMERGGSGGSKQGCGPQALRSR